MFSKFSEEAQKVLVLAKKEMTDLKHPYVGSEHLLLAILSLPKLEVTKKLGTYHLTYDVFRQELIHVVGMGTESNHWFLYTPLLKRVMESAILDSKEKGEEEVTVEHLLLALLEEGEGVAIRILLGLNIDLDAIYNEFTTRLTPKKGKNKKKLLVEEFAVDLNKKAKENEVDPVIGREEEIGRLIEILLRRTKNNPVLIGEAGVGKTAIVEELARRIVEGRVPYQLNDKRILSLSMAGIVAGTKYRGEFEERVGKILKELETNSDLILFIDEIHTLVGAGGAEGAIDASNILKPVLARGKIRLIGATTTGEYKKFIAPDRALDRRFQTISVEEPDEDGIFQILMKLKPIYESYHGVLVTEEILHTIVSLSNKYIYDRKQPDKAIDVLDEVCAKVSIVKSKQDLELEELKGKIHSLVVEKNEAIVKQDFEKASLLKREEQKLENDKNNLELKAMDKRNVRTVTKEMVAEVIHLKTKIPVYEVQNEDRKKLQQLEKSLNKKILGEEKVIHEISNMTKKVRLGLKKQNRPHSFLLVGPTGVGKTALVKEYAEVFYGKDHLIRLDMSEYKESFTVSKIIGSPPGYVGYSDYKNVAEEIKNHPHSVLLLDEIEKAHPSVLHLFLQVLDEGYLKDSKGDIVRFDNVTIFMTSNLGFEHDSVGFQGKSSENVLSSLKEYFSMEFLNRIDQVFVFDPISKETIHKIVEKRLRDVKRRYQEEQIQVSFSPSVVEEIISLSQYEQFGARKVDKIINDKLDLYIIDQILNGEKRIKINTLS